MAENLRVQLLLNMEQALYQLHRHRASSRANSIWLGFSFLYSISLWLAQVCTVSSPDIRIRHDRGGYLASRCN